MVYIWCIFAHCFAFVVLLQMLCMIKQNITLFTFIGTGNVDVLHV